MPSKLKNMYKFKIITLITCILMKSVGATGNQIDSNQPHKIWITNQDYLTLPSIFKSNISETKSSYNDGFTYINFQKVDTDYYRYLEYMESSSETFKKLLKKVNFYWFNNKNFEIKALKDHIYTLKESHIYLNDSENYLVILDFIINLPHNKTKIIEFKITGFDSSFETFESRINNTKNILQGIKSSVNQ